MTHTYELQALTDIWTGDLHGKPGRTISTGLLGSIRWWFEVFVRGVGGTACDPSMEGRTCQGRNHCVVCEFFGCTGWARKFRFDVLDSNGTVQQGRIGKGARFSLRFAPLRAVEANEWGLVGLTVRLIAEYGALGGKTVLKPSEQNAKTQHADFGLVRCCAPIDIESSREVLSTYVSGWTPKVIDAHGASWASCKHMWFVAGHHLTRQSNDKSSFNYVLGRPAPKRESGGGDSWLAGSRGASKKVFSFEQPPRTFGFVKAPAEFGEMREKLRGVWNLSLSSDHWFVSGDTILDRVCRTEEHS